MIISIKMLYMLFVHVYTVCLHRKISVNIYIAMETVVTLESLDSYFFLIFF